MKINHLKIENFRNYIGEHFFEFNRDITILYGENGFGKSSFFDAIEWVITGKIDRFSDNVRGTIEKEDIVNKNVIEDGRVTCRVIIAFDKFQIARKFIYDPHRYEKNYSNIFVEIRDLQGDFLYDDNNRLINTKEKVNTFLEKTLRNANNKDQQNLLQIIKSTSILSQDQIKEFITKDKGEGTFRSMANIMGYKSVLNLSDNINKLVNEFSNKKAKFDEKSKSISHEMDSIDKFLKPEPEEQKLFLNQLGIDLDKRSKDISNDLKDLEEKAYEQSYKSTEIINQINEIINYSENNIYPVTEVDDFRQLEIEVAKKLSRFEKKIYNYEGMLKELANRLTRFSEIKDNIEEHENLQRYYKEIKLDLSKLNIEVENQDTVKSYIKNIEEKIKHNNNMLGEWDYASVNKDSFKYHNDIVNNFDHNSKNLDKQILRISNLRKKRRKILEVIKNNIEESRGADLSKVYNNTISIKEYILKHDHEKFQTCPVCSSDVGTELLTRIEYNLSFYEKEMNRANDYIHKLTSFRNMLENKIDSLNNKYESLNEEKRLLNHSYKKSSDGINTITQNTYYNSKIIHAPIEIINTAIKDLERSLLKDRRALSLLYKLKKLYEDNHFKEEKTSLTSQRMEKNIKLGLKLKDRINNRNDYLYKQNEIYNKLQIDIKRLKDLIKDFDENYDLNKMNNLLYSFSANANFYRGRIKKINESKNLLDIIKENKKVRSKLDSLRREQKIYERDSLTIEKMITSLTKKKAEITNEFGESTKTLFNTEDSAIQKYFSFLNPLPSRSKIIFEGSEDELHLKVSFDNYDKEATKKSQGITSPKFILSSGQLNVLAISIFLAMNQAQNTHNLNFVAIDDPIQNMDDVNQFSICDVLSLLDKQIIISTHDFEFVKLFLKKNDYQKEKIQIFKLESPYLTNDKIKKTYLK